MMIFNVIAVNKYWLAGAFTAPAVFLMATATATLTAGLWLWRYREFADLHLFQSGALTTLYAVLHRFRAAPNDYRPLPILLYGGTYLAYATFCLAMARGARTLRTKAKPTPSDADWQGAWTLWAHATTGVVVVLAAISALLGRGGDTRATSRRWPWLLASSTASARPCSTTRS